MIENIISNLIPVRSIFWWDFILLNWYLVFIILIWYFLSKKKYLNLNIIMLFLVIYLFILIVFNIKEFSFYYLWVYSFCLLVIWYSIWLINFKKLNKEKSTIRKLSIRYDYILFFILILYILFYITINNWNFYNIIEADSWIHLSKILKFDNTNLSPIFLWEYHHYPIFSYFVFDYISQFLWIKNIIFFYWLLWLLFSLIVLLLYYVLITNFTQDKRVALLSLFLILSFNAVFIPNFYVFFLLLLIFLIIFKLLKYKENKILKILLIMILIMWVYFTHYLGAIMISVFIVLYFFLYLLQKKCWNFFNKINIFFIRIYNNFIQNTKLSLNLIVILLLLILFSYTVLTDDILYTSYSEIGLNYNNIVYFISIAFIIPTIWLINKMFTENKLILIYFYSIIIYFANIIFYYTHLFIFHHRYFPEFAIKFILWPFAILLLFRIFNRKYNKLLILVVLLLYALSTNYVWYKYLYNYVRWSNNYRKNLISDLTKYKKKFNKKVLFIEPYSFLNRYVVVDLNSYIYAVNYKNKWPKPFTTIPWRIDKFAFSHPWDRYNLAMNFLNDPNYKSYKNLFKYKIDYFIFSKKTKYKKVINFFRESGFEIIETKNYFIILAK